MIVSKNADHYTDTVDKRRFTVVHVEKDVQVLIITSVNLLVPTPV